MANEHEAVLESAARGFCIHLRPLDRRDVVSWVEMDHQQKEQSTEVSKEQYRSFAIYVHGPVKLRFLSCLDPPSGPHLP